MMWKNPHRYTSSERYQPPELRRVPFAEPAPRFLVTKTVIVGLALYLLLIFILGSGHVR
jgi:hypothetical protein